MTDSNIIKALECCASIHHRECRICPLYQVKDCIEIKSKIALDIIKNQQKFILNLKMKIDESSKNITNDC